MPLSAMTIAGVSPSLLQVYTELVCRDIRRPAPYGLPISVSESLLPSITPYTPEPRPVSNLEARSAHLVFLSRDESDVWLTGDGDSGEEQSCAKDPIVQAAVSKLVTGMFFPYI